MTTWGDIANQLLDAAAASGVTVARKFVAPGPQFARDCSLLAVVMLRPGVRPLGSAGGIGGTCAIVPTHSFQIVYADDCVPVPSDSGTPPAPAAVTNWSTSFLDNCGRVFDAITDAVVNDQIAGGCQNVGISDGEMRGPSGRMASMIVPITVSLFNEGV